MLYILAFPDRAGKYISVEFWKTIDTTIDIIDLEMNCGSGLQYRFLCGYNFCIKEEMCAHTHSHTPCYPEEHIFDP